MIAWISIALSLLSPAHATFQARLNEGLDPRSRIIFDQPASFFENCQPRPAVVEGRDPVTGKIRKISIKIYKNRVQPRPQGGVLVVPPTGGLTNLELDFADRLCDKGFETWVIQEWSPGQKDFKIEVDPRSHDRIARQSVAAIRHITNHMPERIGILGTSAGAIIATGALGVDPNIRVGVLIAGGADIATIADRSDLPDLVAIKKARIQHYGWKESEYAKKLRSFIKLDPLTAKANARGKRVGMVISLEDTTVPVANQILLEKELKADRITEISAGHFWGIVRAFLLESYKVEAYFERHLR